MGLYTNYLVWVEGVLMFQNQQCEVDMPDNDGKVDTVPGGRQGPAPGADVTTITLTNARPKAGADYDFALAKRNRAEIGVEVQQQGQTEVLDGTFICVSYKGDSSSGAGVIESVVLESVGSPAPIFE